MKADISLITAEEIVAEIFGGMVETLIADGRIEIRGFGSFENRVYDSRTGRNPKTGSEVIVSSKKRPFFKVGKDIKERILEN
jgi:integration host factor subunit beta